MPLATTSVVVLQSLNSFLFNFITCSIGPQSAHVYNQSLRMEVRDNIGDQLRILKILIIDHLTEC